MYFFRVIFDFTITIKHFVLFSFFCTLLQSPPTKNTRVRKYITFSQNCGLRISSRDLNVDRCFCFVFWNKISHFTTFTCQFHQHLTNSSIFAVYCCTFLSEGNWKNLKKLVKLVADINFTNILIAAAVLRFSFALFCQNEIGRI